MIWTIHILSLLFGYYTARHDIPAVDNFTDFGSTPKHQRQFHGANWKLKFLFCVPMFLMAYFANEGLLNAFLFFIAAGLDIWVVFDPVIARGRKNKMVWYYLSKGNQVDRLLISIFGVKAGIYKTIICIILNVLIYFFKS